MKVKYSDLLFKCIGDIPTSGMTIAMHRDLSPLLDTIAKAKDSISVDPKFIPLIKERVSSYMWDFRHPDLFSFDDYIKDL